MVLAEEQVEYTLGPHQEILVDPSMVLTIEEVSSSEFD
jgi:hypothetical protein